MAGKRWASRRCRIGCGKASENKFETFKSWKIQHNVCFFFRFWTSEPEVQRTFWSNLSQSTNLKAQIWESYNFFSIRVRRFSANCANTFRWSCTVYKTAVGKWLSQISVDAQCALHEAAESVNEAAIRSIKSWKISDFKSCFVADQSVAFGRSIVHQLRPSIDRHSIILFIISNLLCRVVATFILLCPKATRISPKMSYFDYLLRGFSRRLLNRLSWTRFRFSRYIRWRQSDVFDISENFWELSS